MRSLRQIFLLGILFAVSGCGTLTRGFSQDIAIETVPPGATLTLSNGATCTSPCTVNVERLASPTVRATKPGCEDAVQEIPASFPEGGTTWLSFIDFGTGSAAEHQPNPTTVKLICNDKGPVEMTSYDDATVALLHGGESQEIVLPSFDESAFQRKGYQPFRPSLAPSPFSPKDQPRP